jgi:hypothetical protein
MFSIRCIRQHFVSKDHATISLPNVNSRLPPFQNQHLARNIPVHSVSKCMITNSISFHGHLTTDRKAFGHPVRKVQRNYHSKWMAGRHKKQNGLFHFHIKKDDPTLLCCVILILSYTILKTASSHIVPLSYPDDVTANSRS